MRSNTKDLCNIYSAECLQAVEDTNDRTRKAMMFEMAMAWLRLADHAEDIGNILTDMVVVRSDH